MSVQKMRNKVQNESGPAKAFRQPASRGRMLLYSLLSAVATVIAIWVFLEGSELVAMGTLGVAMILGAVAYDNWRRLEP